MIGAILIDLLVLGAVGAFAWAGWQLGAATSTLRFVASLTGFVLAALLRDPIGSVIKSITGGSVDFSRLVAMLLVGVGTYLAVASLVKWWFGRRAARRELDPDLELVPDPFDDPRIGAIPGGFLGLGWVLLFASMLVLLPADNLISRAAVKSLTGGMLVRQEVALKWIAEGFPHYTQTLPKGEDGAVLVVEGEDPVEMHTRLVEDLEDDREAKDKLRAGIDLLRIEANVTELSWNIEVADVAERHARALFEEGYLGGKSPSGQSVGTRVRSSLGDSSSLYEDKVGLIAIWSHSPANAIKAIVEDRKANGLVTDEDWTEYGIGVISGGWFNGDVYVVALIARTPPDDAAETSGDGNSTEEGSSSGDAVDDGVTEAFTDENGDGKPDSVAIDPDAGDDQTDTDGDGIPDIGDADPLTPDACTVDASSPDCSQPAGP